MKNIFNKKLFAEAYRQIKVPFALFLGLMLGISGLVCFITIFEAIADFKLTGNTTVIYASEVFSMLFAGFIIIVPIFTFKLFSFLTKRNGSDFYHSVPVTRTCMIFTYSAAILCFTTLILIAASIIPIIAYSTTGKYTTFYMSDATGVIVNSLVCMVLVLGLCLLSCSLTGTMFTNILFLIIIAFGPRLIITMLTDALSSTLGDIISYSPDFGFFSSRTNLIFNLFANEFLYYEESSIYELSGSTIYTLILGIIYIALAFVAFNKRKSEQAEKSSNNPVVHHTLRTCLGFFFCLIATIACYSTYGSDRDYLFIQVAIYVFLAIAAMVSYELLTTRSFKNLLNILVFAPVIAILCLVSYFALTTAEANILAYTPDASEIDYVTYSNGDAYYYDSSDNYFDYMLKSVKFDDERLLSIITNALNEEVASFKTYRNTEYSSWFGDYIGKRNTLNFTFVEGGKQTSRVIYLNDSDYNEVLDIIYQNEDYRNAYLKFPKDYEIIWGNERFTDAEMKQLLECLEAELATLSHEDVLTTLSTHAYPENCLFDFECRTVIKSKTYYFNPKISDLTPNTLATAFKILQKSSASHQTALSDIKTFLEDFTPTDTDYSYFWLNLYVFNTQTNELVANIFIDEYSEIDFKYNGYDCNSYEDLEAAYFDLFDAAISDSDGKYLIMLDFSYNQNSSYGETYSHFFVNDCEELQTLLDYNCCNINIFEN